MTSQDVFYGELLDQTVTEPHYRGDFSGLKSADATAQAASQVDEIIREVTELKWLHVHHNSLLPVNNLLYEILTMIFRYCVPSTDPGYNLQLTADEMTKRFSHCFAFSKVCRTWRNIALSDPLLWVRPLFSRRRLAEEMVLRARGLPLDVDIQKCEGNHDVLKAMESILKADLRHLSLKISSNHIGDLDYPEFSPFKTVQSIAIESTDPCTIRYGGLWRSQPTSLKSLTFKHCYFVRFDIKGHPANYMDLESLSLIMPMTPSQSLPQWSIKAMISVCQRSTTLRSLHLEHALRPNYPDEDHVEPRLVMPHLRILEIADTTPVICTLLDRIDCPNLRTLNLETRIGRNGGADLDSLAARVCAWMKTWGGYALERMNISLEIKEEIENDIQLWSICKVVGWLGTREGEQTNAPRFQVSLGLYRVDPWAVLEDFLNPFPLDSLASLVVFGADPVSPAGEPSFWRRLSLLPALTYLEINKPALTMFLPCYVYDEHIRAMSTNGFPALHKLTLGQLSGYRADLRKAPFRYLAGILSIREQKGKPLPELEVPHCLFEIGIQEFIASMQNLSTKLVIS
ncbi:hypothetical protein BDW22DRAFT_1430548 [Trametopsis cervina]|nr:hypothetical protein BDW22DRAFT_1430548 [Trametopsis cervina]